MSKYLMMLLGFCVLTSAAVTQTQNPLVLNDGSQLAVEGPFLVTSDPCKEAHQVFTVPVDATRLDTDFVLLPWPRGIEIRVINAFGIVDVDGVSLQASTLSFTLKARAYGVLVPPVATPGTNQTCEGGQTAFIEAEVIIHYHPSPGPTPAYRAPNPDLRLALNVALFKQISAGFKNYKLGDQIDLSNYWYLFCHDGRPLSVIINNPPSFSTTGYLNSDGSYGTIISTSASLEADIDSGCLLNQIHIPSQANLSTTVGQITKPGGVAVSGTATFNYSLLGFSVSHTASISLPLPIPPISAIPVDFPTSPDVTLQFGTFDGTTFKPTPNPSHKDIPLEVNVSSVGGSTSDNNTLLIDASIGTPKLVPVSNHADAIAFNTSDVPLWSNLPFGITIRNSFFGSAGPSKPNVGFMGALLPIRAEGITTGLLHKHFEIVFDGGSAILATGPSDPAVSIALTTTYAKIGDRSPLGGHGSLIKKVTAQILLDRIQINNGVISFHVEDFRIFIKGHFLFFPITLPSKQLQAALNNGELSLTSTFPTTIQLPNCVYSNFDKTYSTPGTCNTQRMQSYVGYMSGPRTATLTVDPTTLTLRPNHFEIDGQQWNGIQAAGQMSVTQQ